MKFLKNYKTHEIIFIALFVFFMYYKPIICFLLMGSYVSSKSIDHLIFLKYILKNGMPHIGEIVSYENDRGYKTPIITFEVEGQHIKQIPQGHVSSDIDKFTSYKKNIGKTVSLLYDPRNPKKFILTKDKNSSYLGMALTLLMGIIFIALGIASLIGYINIDFS